MNPKPKLEIVARELDTEHRALDVFHDERLEQQLTAFDRASGLIQKCAERLRVRNEINGQIAVLNNHTRLYEAGQRLVTARTELERRRNEYLNLGHEHQVKAKEKETTVAKLEADREEHLTRAVKAQVEREIERAAMQSRIDAIVKPFKSEPELTPEQRRAQEKRTCEIRLAELKAQKQEALKIADEDERLFRVNAIDAALEREYERWARLI